jgi:redox-sensing transcriptional repressor
VTVDRGTRPTRRAVPSTRTPGEQLATAVPGEVGDTARPVPAATVARLAVYLRVLTTLLGEGRGVVSSEELAAAAGVNSAKLRKDLSHIGSSGVRGVGYDVSRLTAEVEATLGLTRPHAVALVGVGNLGHALAGYGGFAQRGFPVAALFDVDPALVGT